ncbi:FG-GAP-like repeat-containing protein [Streptomyces sp. NPDC057271]|uniref:FG-GAP-like repeat-containing protein n=1 Tax=unclassified Streptomyces TaxID=2593676 RepID=UPI0036356727
MDASTPPETPGQAPAPEDAPVNPDLTAAESRKARRRRRYATLSAVLAAVVALPLAVHLTRDSAPAAPRAERKDSGSRPLDTAEALRQAKRTGKDVEVTAKRTAHSTVWAQPDGLMRMRTYSDTIRAKVDGEWKKIDTTLKRVKGGYAPAAVNDPLLFSAGDADATGGPHATGGTDTARSMHTTGTDTADGTDTAGEATRASRAVRRSPLPSAVTAEDGRAWSELVRLTVEGHDLVVSWPGPLPAPIVDGPRALYENVRPGIDLLLTARDSGYSHVLIVHTPEAAKDPLLADLDYRLTSPTLKFKLNDDSDVVTAMDSNGQEMATSPTPYLWDSAGAVRTTLGESQPELDPALGDTALTLPGLAGPQPGSHDSVLDATLDTDGVLDLAVNTKALADPDMVYPVFIDPTFKGRKANWTLLYQKYPNSSFLNGQNFNDGTNEARVGYEATTGGLSRSVFTFRDTHLLDGATVKESYLRILQTYSWGCSPRQYNVHLTPQISSTTTFNNFPLSGWGSPVGSETSGWGYKSGSCPDSWRKIPIDSAVQKAAASGWPTITLGLKAANEGDTAAWKKLMANGETSPYIETEYNHKPDEPLQSKMTLNGRTCVLGAPFPSVGKIDLTFKVTGYDTDKDLTNIHLKVWPTGDVAHPVVDKNYSPSSDGVISPTIDWEEFTSGTTYSWSARTIDSEGAASHFGPANTGLYCQFTVDNNVPSSPVVSSADGRFPPMGDKSDQWSTVELGVGGQFTFATAPDGEAKDTSVVGYEYNFNSTNYTAYPRLTTTQGAAVTKSLTPPMAGINILHVWAVDGADNRSRAASYGILVTPRKVIDPPGDVSGDGTPDLLAVGPAGELRHYPALPGGDVHVAMGGAYNTAGDLGDGYWTDTTGQKPALISHATDWFPGDGINDLVARMPDGRMYVYPGDGYGSFNTDARIALLLPTGAPDPSTLTQVKVTGDITGDGLPDMLARAGVQLWAFTGYTGGSFAEARLLADGGWDTRDVVTAGDITGDGVADLLFRGEETGRGLLLRHGKAAAGGGVDLNSLALAASSGTGRDEVYGTTGWSRTNIPMIMGTADASGDGIPDLWTAKADGTLRFYLGGRSVHGASTLVGESSWNTLLTLG